MAQKEAIIEALKILGGRAKLNDIYAQAYRLADFSGSKDWKATIRWYLQKETNCFRSTKRGYWELISFQEEVFLLNQQIAELQQLIAEKDEEIKVLKKVKTEDEFVIKYVKKVMLLFKRDKDAVEKIRIVMEALGRHDAEKILDEFLQGKEEEAIKKVINIQSNNSQVFTGDITDSEFNGGGTENEK